MAYLLDTDTWSYFLRGKHGVRERVSAIDESELAICRVSVAELNVLAIRSSSKRRAAQVARLARTVEFFDVDESVWDLFPHVYAELLRRGWTTGMPDVLIGCCAAVHDAVVVSNNVKHFEHVCDVLGLELENWAEAESG